MTPTKAIRLAGIVAATLGIVTVSRANTEDDFLSGANLTPASATGIYSNGLPTSASDVVIRTVSASTISLTINGGSNLSVGSLDFVVPTTANYNLSSSSATAATLTLGSATGSNSFAPNSADIFYVGPSVTGSIFVGINAAGSSTAAPLNVVLNQSGNFDIQAGTTYIYSAISEATAGTSVTKTGSGTLRFLNNNTYTGGTTINNGTILVDYRTTASLLTASTDALSSTAALTLGGGIYQQETNTVAGNQTVNGLVLTSGQSAIQLTTAGTANVLLSVGNITRSIGSAFDLTQVTNAAPSATNGLVTTQANNASGILGAYATVGGNDYATNSGGNVVAYTGYSNVATNGTIASSANTNYRIPNAATTQTISLVATGTTDISTLLNTNAGAITLNVGTGNILRFGAVGGVLGTLANSPTMTISGGTVTAGGADNTPGELVITNASGSSITINSVIADNGTGQVSLVRNFSGGNFNVNGVNTYTGATYINNGNIVIGANTALGALSGGTFANLYLNGGTLSTGTAFSLGNGTVNRNIVVADRGAVLSESATSGALTINGVISGVGGVRVLGTGTTVFGGANTYTNPTTITNGTLTLANAAALQAATGLVTVGSGTLNSTVANANLGGSLANTGGTIAPNGGSVGMLTLAAGRTFTMSAGTLSLNFTSTTAYDSIAGTSTGSFTLTGGTLNLNSQVPDYTASYTVLSGFGTGAASGVTFTNYDSTDYTASLSNAGVLSFTAVAVPEPGTAAMMAIFGMITVFEIVRRTRRSRSAGALLN